MKAHTQRMPESILKSQTAWPVGIGLIFSGIALLLQFSILFWPVENLVDVIFSRDDSFYYFILAQNIAQTGVSTFDQINITNGIQLLWGLILVPVAWAVPNEIDFLRAVLTLALGVNLLVAVQLFIFGRKVHSAAFGDILAMFWAGMLLDRWNTFDGMEYSLHILIIVLIAQMAWPVISGASRLRRTDALLIGLLLTLNYWVRLDSVLFSITVWIFLCYRIFQTGTHKVSLICLLTLFPAIGGVGYIATSYALGGTVLPISGSAKSVYANRYFDNVDNGLAIREQIRWWLKLQTKPFLALFPDRFLPINVNFNPFRSSSDFVSGALMAFSLVLVVLTLWLKKPRRIVPVLLITFVLIAALHNIIIIKKIGDFSHVSNHYYGWQHFFWIVAAGMVLTLLFEHLSVRRQLIAPLLVVAWGVMYWPNVMFALGHYPATDGGYALSRLKLAERLNETLPEDARVGAWNAGVLAYFLDRPVVNLDGLVNDRYFLEHLKSEAPLWTYLDEQKIGYLIDHDNQDLTARFMETRGQPGSDFRNMVSWDYLEEIEREGEILVLRFSSRE